MSDEIAPRSDGRITSQNSAEMARKRWEKAKEMGAEGAEEAITWLVYGGGKQICDGDTLESRIALYRPLALPEGGAPPYWWWKIIVGARAVVAATDPSHAGNSAAEFVGKATGVMQTGHAQKEISGEGAAFIISEGALERLESILRLVRPPEQSDIIDYVPDDVL